MNQNTLVWLLKSGICSSHMIKLHKQIISLCIRKIYVKALKLLHKRVLCLIKKVDIKNKFIIYSNIDNNLFEFYLFEI